MKAALGILVWFLLALQVRADSWQVDSATYGIKVPANQENTTLFWIMYGGSSPNDPNLAYINMGSGPGAGSPVSYDRTIGWTIGPFTHGAAFYLLVGVRISTYSGQVYKWQFWKNSYNATQNPNGSPGAPGGDVSDTNVALGPTGQPVGANGQEPPQAKVQYKKQIELVNETDTTREYKITVKDADGNVISENIVKVPAGSKMPWKINSDQPFSYEVSRGDLYEDNVEWTPYDSGTGDGLTAGQGGTSPGGTTSGAGGGASSTGAPGEPPATPDEARPGASPDPNAEARHKEMKGELGRIVSQLRSIGGTAHNDSVQEQQAMQAAREAMERFKGASVDAIEAVEDAVKKAGDDVVEKLDESGTGGLDAQEIANKIHEKTTGNVTTATDAVEAANEGSQGIVANLQAVKSSIGVVISSVETIATSYASAQPVGLES